MAAVVKVLLTASHPAAAINKTGECVENRKFKIVTIKRKGSGFLFCSGQKSSETVKKEKYLVQYKVQGAVSVCNECLVVAGRVGSIA